MRRHVYTAAGWVGRQVRVEAWGPFLRRVASRELLLLIMPVLLVLGIWGFASVVDEIGEGTTPAFDEWAIRALRDPDDPARALGPAWLSKSARDITAIGSPPVLCLVTAAVLGWLLIRKSWHEALLMLVATGGGAGLSFVLKGHFTRARPSLVPHLDQVSTYSFPSGHAMASAIVYLTIGAVLARLFSQRRMKLYMIGVAAGIALLVGLSRVYCGVHYPSDVMAGWSAGVAWASLCWLVTIYLQYRGDVARDAETARAAAAPMTEAATAAG
jgi:undecaprenyl-diphosphatase